MTASLKHARDARDSGSASVELAALLPAVALLLAALVAAAQWAVATVRVHGAVATAARVAVTDGVEDARDAVVQLLGPEARVTIARDGDWFTVRVSVSAVWGLDTTAEGASRAQP